MLLAFRRTHRSGPRLWRLVDTSSILRIDGAVCDDAPTSGFFVMLINSSPKAIEEATRSV